MDTNIIPPFTSAVTEMMGSMVGAECTTHPVDLSELNADISGIVTLTGVVHGQVAISMTRPTALALVAQMLGMSPDEVQDDMLGDGVGEVANIVAGNAKSRLAALGHHFHVSLPSIIIGPHHNVDMFQSEDVCHFEVASGVGSFTLSVWLTAESEAG